MSTEINKLVSSAEINAKTEGHGILGPEETDRFLDYMWDESVLLNQVETKRMRANETTIQSVGVGKRILKGATEGVNDGQPASVGFSRVNIVAHKFRADFEMTKDALEDNMEGPGFEDHLVRLMTAQISQDWEDVLLNGDVDTEQDVHLMGQIDGWLKIARTNGAAVDAASVGVTTAEGEAGYQAGELTPSLVRAALKAMPRNKRGNRNLRLFSNSEFIQDLAFTRGIYAQADRGQIGSGERISEAAGWTVPTGFGVDATEVPFMEVSDTGTGELLLTDPKNLAVAIRRNIEVYKEFNVKTDSYEWTTYLRGNAAIFEPSSTVVVSNVQSRA